MDKVHHEEDDREGYFREGTKGHQPRTVETNLYHAFQTIFRFMFLRCRFELTARENEAVKIFIE